MSSPNLKNKRNKNSKLSTGTGKNTALLGAQNNTESQNGNNSIENSMQKSSMKSTYKNFDELETKNDQLKLELAKINSQIDQERFLLMEETTQLNADLTERGFIMSDLSSENKNLMLSLKNLQSDLDDKMQIGKDYLKKMEKLKKEEKNLQKRIEVKEKEIELTQKNQIIVEKDYNRVVGVSNSTEDNKEEQLENELDDLNKYKKKLETDIFNLRKIMKEHKLCPKTKANLMSKLNVITNSYQFEVKKNNMIESNQVLLEEKKEKIKKENEEKIEKEGNNKSISYCSNIRRKVLKKMEKKKSENHIVPPPAFNHIENICNNIDEQYRKKSEDLKNINNNDYNLKQKYLFTENEQVQLANIIPTSYLNEFKERFEALENQRYELADKIRNNKGKQMKNLNSVKIKMNYTELKKKEIKLLTVDLSSNLARKNVNITKLKQEINKVAREFNTWNKLLNIKNNETNRLNKYINNFINRKNETEQNVDANKRKQPKKEMNLQKQSNIFFEYDMNNT